MQSAEENQSVSDTRLDMISKSWRLLTPEEREGVMKLAIVLVSTNIANPQRSSGSKNPVLFQSN